MACAVFIASSGIFHCSTACEVLDPRLGIELTSPALQGFLTTGLLGKSLGFCISDKLLQMLLVHGHTLTNKKLSSLI